MQASEIQFATLLFFIMIAVFIPLRSDGAAATDEIILEVIHTQNTKAIPLHDVFEITFQHDHEYENPFFDVTIEVTFQSPSGKSIVIGGFHYGSSKPPEIHTSEDQRGRRHNRYEFEKQDIWKARFVPQELGEWSYRYTFANSQGMKTTGSGSYNCVEGKRLSHGFLRQHPDNPFRWIFDDGTPYFPIGLQEGWGDWDGNGTSLDTVSMEGPFRMDRTDLVELPPGPLYVRGPSTWPQNADVYARRHSRAGFNLYRFSQRNNTYDLYSDLDHYLVQEGVMTDEILQHLRKYGFRVMYGLFGYQEVFNNEPDNAEGMAKVKRFVKYSVDRWGAYVDFWEFLNEQKAADGWYEIMIPYLRSIDPYHHPITTSWERPELDGIEINAPHWYGNEDELRSDQATASRAEKWKKHGKPVIVGEQGNAVNQDKPRPPGVGGVWDEGSARRMRIRNWTALFNEIAFIFWNTSYARDGHYMNIWLGPQERQYIRAMQDFACRLDADVRMIPVTVSLPEQVRAYGLASESRAGAYLHHFENHNSPVEELTITIDVPIAAKAYWYSPENADILDSFDILPGKQTLKAPSFVMDLALLITPDGAPDVDHDSIPNNTDIDDDNDGAPDSADAFPLESEEWEDKDGDLIGDNLDADVDGDGIGDDTNQNGTPDHEELDFDGDGVNRARAVPWDAFPLDPSEWRDTDGDGIGDNADTDDDDDGWSDEEEIKAGTDPLDRVNFPPDKLNGEFGLNAGEDGTLLKDGVPYCGIGVNYFDAFLRVLIDPEDKSYETGFAELNRYGIPFARVMFSGFWPREMKFYLKDREEYLRRMDAVVKSAEKNGIGLIPSLFWYDAAVPDIVGEPRSYWGKSASRTVAFMRSYVHEIVNRYQHSPAIWGWEMGNEYNLAADLPNAAEHRPAIVPHLETAASRSELDDMTHDILYKAFAEFAEQVRYYDQYHIISTGNSIPRASAWHQREENSWTADSPEQTFEILAGQNPDSVDVISIHVYQDVQDRIPQMMEMARKLKKPLFIGEFGVPGEGAEVEAAFAGLLAIIEKERVPLAALWVYDLKQQSDYTVTGSNARAYQLKAIAEANKRIQKGSIGSAGTLSLPD